MKKKEGNGKKEVVQEIGKKKGINAKLRTKKGNGKERKYGKERKKK